MENIETLLAAVAQTQGFDDDDDAPVARSASPELGFRNPESTAAIRDTPPAPPPPETVVAAAEIGAGERKKRGRPPRGQMAVKSPPAKRSRPEDEEEDVCFICFDGGSLVLCDRRGCPKAYHPACIKRDEAFFKSKAKWNCGWHICSVCMKASHYLCYTCTYSLCKGCTKDADYLCVRGNKGFCSTCMKTIMLIENKDQANNESIQVDFDDKTSWEYLFKVYWVILKEKLSLTLDELIQAKKPWKGVATVGYKPLSNNVIPTSSSVEVHISYNSAKHLELNKPQVEISLPHNDVLRTALPSISNKDAVIPSLDEVSGEMSIRKVTEVREVKEVSGETSISKVTEVREVKEATDKPVIEKSRDDLSIVRDSDKQCICKHTNDKESHKPGIYNSIEWATKDLLEFVAHMKNGDTSTILQFDVQTLLLDYIKRNNLRDPRRKSQIICDQRLKNLFGKPRVGHIEMLKLLEFHFLIKEDSQKNFIPAGFVSSVASEVEVDGNINGLSMPINSRKRKTRKKSDERAPQNNLSEYAAIDVHNINLIYLRRNLMEILIGDRDSFNIKVIGSIVRIRISINEQKQDVHRLVQVVGTTKVSEPYKIGDKTADIMLEVLNLNKKEVVSINAISNQDFTEDECRRLRQSIRCGLVKQFTVGEVQNKAMALQPVRVNDMLEAEISRLNHLRDLASEKGRKKELREYVDKIQLLKSPEERSRRISEIPEIHADPKMSPYYESEEDTKSGENSKKDEYVRPSYSSLPQNGRKFIYPNKKDKQERTVQARKRMIEKTDASGSTISDQQMNQVNINDQAMQRSGLETSTATASVGNSPSSSVIETEKLWHYRDPNGKIQGPFSMMQLRKWSTTGLFPPDMRIWTNHEQYDSLLLNDALIGKFHLASDLSNSELRDEGASGETGVISEVTNVSSGDSKLTEAAMCTNVSVLSDNKTGAIRTDDSGSWLQCWDLLKDGNSRVDDGRAGDLVKDGNSSVNDVLAHEVLKNGNSSVIDVRARDLLEDRNSSANDVQARDLLKDGNSSVNDVQARDLLKDGNSSVNDVQARDLLKDGNPSANDVQARDLLKDGNSSANDVQARDLLKDGESSVNDVHAHDLLKDGDSSVNDVLAHDFLQDGNSSVNDVQACDLLKDRNSSVNDVQARDLLPVSSPMKTYAGLSDRDQENLDVNHGSQNVEHNLTGVTQNPLISGFNLQNQPSNENRVGLSSEDHLRSLKIALGLNDLECGSDLAHGTNKQGMNISILDFPSPTPNTDETKPSVSSDVPMQASEILELLSPTPRSNNEDQPIETKQSGFINFPMPNSGQVWGGTLQLPEVGDEWCGYSPTPVKPPEITSENIATSTSNLPNWLAMINEPIEFDALGEESVSDLLAEVDAMESQGALPSPTSAVKFAREFLEDCRDDCFSSIEEFSRKSDAFSSTGEVQLNSEPSGKLIGSSPVNAFDFFTRSSMHSSASSEGETNNVPSAAHDVVGPSMGLADGVDPGWGTVQGNINLVTVQGNVNLVLGGPGQGMANLNWGANQSTGWVNPNLNRSPINGSLPWGDGQRKYGGERFTSPREWGYQGGRSPWGRQAPYGGGGGGGYSRALPKGQRVCKFYESGHCKKGAFCDYLHP